MLISTRRPFYSKLALRARVVNPGALCVLAQIKVALQSAIYASAECAFAIADRKFAHHIFIFLIGEADVASGHLCVRHHLFAKVIDDWINSISFPIM